MGSKTSKKPEASETWFDTLVSLLMLQYLYDALVWPLRMFQKGLNVLQGIFLFGRDIPVLASVARYYFTYLYAPVVIFTLVFLVNCSLHCTYALLVPQDRPMLMLLHLPPYIYSMTGLVFTGYKVITLVADTMSDSYHSAGDHQYFYLKIRLKKAVSRHPLLLAFNTAAFCAFIIYVAPPGLLGVGLGCVRYLTGFSKILEYDPELTTPAIVCGEAIMLVHLAFMVVSFFVKKSFYVVRDGGGYEGGDEGRRTHAPDETAFFFGIFWPWVVPKVRDLSLLMLALSWGYWFLRHDYVTASSCAVEASIYILVPHIAFNGLCAFTLAEGEVFAAFSYLNSNRRHVPEVAVLTAAYLMWGAWTVSVVQSADVMLLTFLASSALIVRATQIVKVSGEEESAFAQISKRRKRKIKKRQGGGGGGVGALGRILNTLGGFGSHDEGSEPSFDEIAADYSSCYSEEIGFGPAEAQRLTDSFHLTTPLRVSEAAELKSPKKLLELVILYFEKAFLLVFFHSTFFAKEVKENVQHASRRSKGFIEQAKWRVRSRIAIRVVGMACVLLIAPMTSASVVQNLLPERVRRMHSASLHLRAEGVAEDAKSHHVNDVEAESISLFTFTVFRAVRVSSCIASVTVRHITPFFSPYESSISLPEKLAEECFDYEPESTDEGNSSIAALNLNHLVLSMTMQRGDPPNATDTETDAYPSLCKQEWEGVGVWSYAVFSALAYLPPKEFTKGVAFFNSVLKERSGADWEVRHAAESEGINSASFFDVFSPSRKLSVIVIRGTNPVSPLDYLQNIAMYNEAGIYHMTSSVIPFFTLFPQKLITDSILLSSRLEQMFATVFFATSSNKKVVKYYWEHVLKHVKGRREDGAGVVLSGHSLGGAIAKIVGARLGLRGLSFHGPGVVLSHKKFGIPDVAKIHRYTASIVPESDMVPTVDRLGGDVHNILCASRRQDTCHLLESTVVELWNRCPSVRSTLSLSSVHFESQV